MKNDGSVVWVSENGGRIVWMHGNAGSFLCCFWFISVLSLDCLVDSFVNVDMFVSDSHQIFVYLIPIKFLCF